MDHISVCVCTFKRPHLLKRLLDAVKEQETRCAFTFSTVIADNDNAESARAVAMEFAASVGFEVTYCVEPSPNIALARNKVLANAKGNFLAFIDDDEFPVRDWLFNLLSTCKSNNVAGVLGPVLPYFDTEPPAWLAKAGFYDRPRHETGFLLGWQESRTGNVLIRRSIIAGLDEVFRPQFGAGGEDQDFFRRMMAADHTFIWCDEAPVYETVPPQRWTRRFLLQRALLRGQISCRHRQNLWKNIGKSLVAVPLYAIALPFLFIAGHHLFMRYLVKLCDHGGRLLALLGLNPIHERCN